MQDMDIKDRIFKNYQDNMEYFQKNIPSLYNKLIALEMLLEEGRYPQKYELEYMDEGYFDVVDIKSGEKLYKENSNTYSQKLCDEVTYKKSDQTFKSYRKLNIADEDAKIMKRVSPFMVYSSIGEIVNFYNNHHNDDMNLTQIEKYIFLGSGLGLHVKKIVEKFDVQVVLMVEDDIELFRLSLFVTNYKEFLQDRIAYFSIAQQHSEFEGVFNNFFQKAFFKNRYLKFTIFSSYYEEKIEVIRSFLVTRVETTYTNERLLLKNKKVIKSLKEGYKFLDVRKKNNEKYFKDKPFLALGAGPSLAYNAQWIKEHKDNFIIICAFSALKTLKKIGVSPDIAVHIDEDEAITKEMLDNLGDLSFLDDTMIFFSASVSKLLFDSFKKENIYLHEDRTKYKLSKSTLAVTSVGDTVYSFALLFNPSEVYMLGLDMALSFEGETHSKDHFKKFSYEEEKRKNQGDDFQFFNKRIKIKGNLLKEVYTLPIFMLSIPIINIKTRLYKSKDQKIYNLSQNGAYFEDTIPTKIDDVKEFASLDKKEIRDSMKKLFDGYSSTYLDKDEMEAMEKRWKQIEDFGSVIDNFKNYPTTPKENFIRSFVDIVSNIANHPLRYELWEIFYIYGLRIGPYIDDLVYTKEIKLRKKELKELKEIVYKKHKQILDTYKDILEELEDKEK